jgi:hypothetical protein
MSPAGRHSCDTGRIILTNHHRFDACLTEADIKAANSAEETAVPQFNNSPTLCCIADRQYQVLH